MVKRLTTLPSTRSRPTKAIYAPLSRATRTETAVGRIQLIDPSITRVCMASRCFDHGCANGIDRRDAPSALSESARIESIFHRNNNVLGVEYCTNKTATPGTDTMPASTTSADFNPHPRYAAERNRPHPMVRGPLTRHRHRFRDL